MNKLGRLEVNRGQMPFPKHTSSKGVVLSKEMSKRFPNLYEELFLGLSIMSNWGSYSCFVVDSPGEIIDARVFVVCYGSM